MIKNYSLDKMANLLAWFYFVYSGCDTDFFASPVRLFLHFVVAYNMDVVSMIHPWVAGVVDHGVITNWTRIYQIALVAKMINTSASVIAEVLSLLTLCHWIGQRWWQLFV